MIYAYSDKGGNSSEEMGFVKKGARLLLEFKGSSGAQVTPFHFRKKQILTFMKPFLLAFSTNIYFVQQLLNKQLLILYKMKIALTLFEDLCSRICNKKKRLLKMIWRPQGLAPHFLMHWK